MNLLMVGCSFQNTPVAMRERLAFDGPKLNAALAEVNGRYGFEVVIVSTCNRVEMYTARAVPAPPDAELLVEFLAEFHGVPLKDVRAHVYQEVNAGAVQHLFRVVASLDSLIVGEGQIAGQVKRAYETAHEQATAGAVLHPLFQHAHAVAKRVRTETGIARGHVSVSSVAVDYVRQVFDHFNDKTILVIGAGKMGALDAEAPARACNRSASSLPIAARRRPSPWRQAAAACPSPGRSLTTPWSRPTSSSAQPVPPSRS